MITPIASEEPPTKRPAKLQLSSLTTGSGPLAQLNWQTKTADAVWTREEFTSLCEHLHNDNPPFHYVIGFRDEAGCKKYVRSRTKTAACAISWAWGSITGKSKSKIAFAPYASNSRQQSRWGGLDFDAHNGEHDRARELAFAAFRVLLNAPDLAVILETSGSGGWHLWAISQEFHDKANGFSCSSTLLHLSGRQSQVASVKFSRRTIYRAVSEKQCALQVRGIRARKGTTRSYGKIPALPLNQFYRGSQKLGH